MNAKTAIIKRYLDKFPLKYILTMLFERDGADCPRAELRINMRLDTSVKRNIRFQKNFFFYFNGGQFALIFKIKIVLNIYKMENVISGHI